MRLKTLARRLDNLQAEIEAEADRVAEEAYQAAQQDFDYRLAYFLHFALQADDGGRDDTFLRFRQWYEENGDGQLRELAIAWRKRRMAMYPAAVDMWSQYGVRIQANHGTFGIGSVTTVAGDMPYGGGDEAIVSIDVAEKLIDSHLWSFVEEWIPGE